MLNEFGKDAIVANAAVFRNRVHLTIYFGSEGDAAADTFCRLALGEGHSLSIYTTQNASIS